MPLQVGSVLAGRRVLAVQGRGSSGTVYRTTTQDGLLEALKVLDPDVGRTELGRARFRREAEIAQSLHHRHIVAVHDHGQSRRRGAPGTAPPLLWTALELLEGGTAARLVPPGRRPPDTALVLEVAAQVAAGLDHAHAHDVIHGDVKPANLLLSGDVAPRAVVSDFGIARLVDDSRPLARNGRVLGSLPYASPEVLQALRLTPATDVYSLGATLVELLTGEPPFPRATTFAVVHAHLSTPPPRVSRRRRWVPAALDPVVARALAKDPAQRPGSCAALVEAVAGALGPAAGARSAQAS